MALSNRALAQNLASVAQWPLKYTMILVIYGGWTVEVNAGAARAVTDGRTDRRTTSNLNNACAEGVIMLEIRIRR